MADKGWGEGECWPDLEGAKRTGEKKREVTQVCEACGQPTPRSAPHEKKRKKRHKKHKDGGFLRKAKLQEAAAAEALEREQAGAKAAVEAAQSEAAASEESLGITRLAYKAAEGKLRQIRANAAALSPWCRRSSTQPVRYVDQPRVHSS
jgi:hypothetical protein